MRSETKIIVFVDIVKDVKGKKEILLKVLLML